MSPKRFRSEFRELLLELHWRQWCALGVAAQVEPEQNWVIDLEALVASSSRLGPLDARLTKRAREWLALNGDWVSTSRLRRIADAFKAATGADVQMAEPELHGRPRVVHPVVTQPALVQLQLRALLGMDVRADVFTYLLFNRSGNSSSISRALYVNQKRVYNILERWGSAGLVRRTSGGYSLVDAAVAPGIAEARNRVEWLNWTMTCMVLVRLHESMTRTGTDERYVLASLARDVAPDLEQQAAAVGITLERPDRYPGVDYFGPFSDGVVAWLRRLIDKPG